MPTSNKTTTQARDSQVIAGISKDLKTVSSLSLAGTKYTPTTLTDLIQSRISAANAVATARANWLAAVKTYQAVFTVVQEVESGLKQYVINAYGKTSTVLADFGFVVSKRATQTTEDLTLAIQKRAATRLARGTMSKKAKAKIKGTVPTPAQPTVPTATATTPAPSVPTVNLVVTTQPTASAPAPTVPTVATPAVVATIAPPKS